MKSQEIMCPHCGAVIEVKVPDNSQVVGFRKDYNYSITYLSNINFKDVEIEIPKGSHQRPYSNSNCNRFFLVSIKHGMPTPKNTYQKPDWSVEI